MNKLTKYGLTALAGSLVATSVSAGELGVSGSWSWSYDSADSDEFGNPMSMGDSVTFSGSGETDQGWTAGVSYELDGGNYDDYKLTLDMGDSGKLTFSGASVTGDRIHMVNDIVPAADTPVMSMTDSATAYGVADGADATGNRDRCETLAPNPCYGYMQNQQGNQIAGSPEINYNIGLAWTLPLGSMDLTLSTNYYWQDEFYASNFNNISNKVDDWSMWNASARVSGESWYAEAWVKNIEDNDNVTGHYLTSSVSALFTNQFILDPQTYGLSVGYQF